MLADELVRLAPNVVVAATVAAALAAKPIMPATPIVCPFLTDPIRLGLVASHNRPGGNITEIMLTLDGLLGKQLQLMRGLMPSAKRSGILLNMRVTRRIWPSSAMPSPQRRYRPSISRHDQNTPFCSRPGVSWQRISAALAVVIDIKTMAVAIPFISTPNATLIPPAVQSILCSGLFQRD
jgi:hypothetical protein